MSSLSPSGPCQRGGREGGGGGGGGVEHTNSIGNDTVMHHKLKTEVQAAYNTNEYMYEGIQLSVKRFKKFLN